MKNFRFLQFFMVGLCNVVCSGPTYAADPKVLATEDLSEMSIEELMQVKIVSEATGSKQTVSKAPAIIKIITAADIKAMGATDLEELLETVPELHVARKPHAYNPLYLLRGIYSTNNPEVMVLINNVPINSTQYGDRGDGWGRMPVNAIARIEVIRGSGAVVHADAFAGAINIVTKTQQDIPGTEIGGRVGSFSSTETWLLHSGNYRGFDTVATFEYSDTEGPHKIIEADRQTALDRQFGTHASYAPAAVSLANRSYDAHLELSREKWRWRSGIQARQVSAGAGFTNALSPLSHPESLRLLTDLSYNNPSFADHWEVSAQLSYFELQWKTAGIYILLPPGTLGSQFPEGQLARTFTGERQTRFNLSAFYTGWANHTWRFETGYSNVDAYKVEIERNYDIYTNRPFNGMADLSDTPATYLPEMTRKSWRLLVQDAWQFTPAWELNLGLRYYDYSDFGNTLNPHVGLVWQPRPNLVTKLLYGKAFRAPSYSELYVVSRINTGNPQLQPETIQTTELALGYQPTNHLEFNLDVFAYEVADAIIYLPLPSGKTQPHNAGNKTGHGVSLEAEWKANDSLKLSGNYTFQTAKDQQSHQIPNAPRHKFYFRTDWQFLPDWNLDMQANWVGQRYRAAGDTRPPVDNYTTVDLTLRYQSEKQPWEMGLSVRNLFDTDAREPSDSSIPNDLPLAGRSLWGEVRYRFGTMTQN